MSGAPPLLAARAAVDAARAAVVDAEASLSRATAERDKLAVELDGAERIYGDTPNAEHAEGVAKYRELLAFAELRRAGVQRRHDAAVGELEFAVKDHARLASADAIDRAARDSLIASLRPIVLELAAIGEAPAVDIFAGSDEELDERLARAADWARLNAHAQRTVHACLNDRSTAMVEVRLFAETLGEAPPSFSSFPPRLVQLWVELERHAAQNRPLIFGEDSTHDLFCRVLSAIDNDRWVNRDGEAREVARAMWTQGGAHPGMDLADSARALILCGEVNRAKANLPNPPSPRSPCPGDDVIGDVLFGRRPKNYERRENAGSLTDLNAARTLLPRISNA